MIPMMPEKLQAWLEQLPKEDAALLLVWLDENPNAVQDMIAWLCESHPGLQDRV